MRKADVGPEQDLVSNCKLLMRDIALIGQVGSRRKPINSLIMYSDLSTRVDIFIEYNHLRFCLLPLDGGRRFSGDVVGDSGDPFHLVDNASGQQIEKLKREMREAGGHKIHGLHGA